MKVLIVLGGIWFAGAAFYLYRIWKNIKPYRKAMRDTEDHLSQIHRDY